MKTYKCKVRLNGEVKDEVRKKDVTAAEIKMLRKIHGDDAVLDVSETGAVNRTEAAERERLAQLYGEAAVVALFGAPKIEITAEIEPQAIEDELPLVKRDSEALVA